MDKSCLSYGRIVNISLENTPNQSIHWHDNLEILLVIEGKAKIHISFENIELNKNDIMVINCSEPHRIYDCSEDSKLMCVKLNKDYCYSIHSNLYEALAVSDYDITFKNLNSLKDLLTSNIYALVKLISKTDEINDTNDVLIHERIKTLLNNLVSSYMPKLSFEYLTKKIPEEKIEMIHRMIRYLYDNYDKDVNLQEFSDQEFFNFYYVSHNIKEITGTSFRDWLNYVRVEQSEKLLLNTDKSITTISEECGFSDVRYYNKHFYKWHKVTPSAFRRLYKQSYAAAHHLQEAEDIDQRTSDTDIATYFKSSKKEEKEIERFYDIQIDFNGNYVKESKNKTEKLLPGRFECNEDQLIYPDWWENLNTVKEELKMKSLYININLYESYLGLSHLEVKNFVKGINYLVANKVTPVLCVAITGDIRHCINELQKILKSLTRQTTPLKIFQIEVRVEQDDITDDEKTAIYKSFRDKAIQLFSDISIKSQKQSNGRKLRRMLESPVVLSSIISPSGLKTYQYHFHYLLARMEKNIIAEGENYIVCGGRDRLGIIIYQNTPEKVRVEKYQMSIHNANCSYKVIKYRQLLQDYDLNRISQNIKMMESLDAKEKELFNKMTFPKISFDYMAESKDQELTFQIEENGILIGEIIKIL